MIMVAQAVVAVYTLDISGKPEVCSVRKRYDCLIRLKPIKKWLNHPKLI